MYDFPVLWDLDVWLLTDAEEHQNSFTLVRRCEDCRSERGRLQTQSAGRMAIAIALDKAEECTKVLRTDWR